jgi:glycosyltransferase involved in cell wall biosynthesis
MGPVLIENEICNEMRATVIITTYNWPEALKITLKSIIQQSIRSIEIIVADDGSEAATAQAIKEVLIPSNMPWMHVRHADSGIRQARIKNLAVKYSQSPYLIFIDHDVVLHPHFLNDHLSMAERSLFLQGKRVFLSEYYTRKILSRNHFIPPNPFLRGLENRKNAIRAPKLGKLLAKPKRFQTSLRGCNLSMYKKDFLNVDGYDETFDQLWGREDSDICYRLFHSGLRLKNLWFSALQYHLYHKVIKRRGKDRLDSELQIIHKEKRIRALKGFSKLSSEGAIMAASDKY